MSKLNISRLTNENEDGAPYISGITTFSSTAFLDPPKGNTAQRPEYVKPGMIRFNTDSAHLEYYNGVEWTEVLVANNSLDGGARGVFGAGFTPTPSNTFLNVIEFITISTLGNVIDFGDLSVDKGAISACSSSTRGVVAGGYTSNVKLNVIEFITISSTGNSQDFGDLSGVRAEISACSSSTRGVFGGGYTPTPATTFLNVIEYITIASTGNAQDFGDLSVSKSNSSSCSSSTRGVFGGGFTPTIVNTIDYITIASTGNAVDFGYLSAGKYSLTACSSSTRGVFGGGFTPTPATTLFNVIEFITISSTGNSQDFGDLSAGKSSLSACSSSTRGVFGGGYTNTPAASRLNVIEYITIASTGNAVDFGDLTVPKNVLAACSNGHGGL
jgi:hypothetical protein